DFAITGECGSNLRITNQLRGLHVVKLIASGQEAHAGHLWYGENALLKLYEAVNTILQHYPTPKVPTWQTTVSLAKIETNNITHNIVPADATALLDIRFIPEDAENILKNIQSFLPEGVIMEKIKFMPVHKTEKTNTYLQKLAQALEGVTQKTPEITPSYAGSDIIFYSMHHINGVEFGPVGEGHHSDEEWVDIKSLGHYYQILKDFLLSVK
ncbi:MAG TPA: M20 family metallopeptidase, partial [Methylomirabilota bacterium]|nr:M20 family metallopeptidase [Methylomirabilota bacterium]